MSVTQLAVFIENKPGRLAAATRLLGDAGINIRGFSIADTQDYGILRILVDQEEAARMTLRTHGFTVYESRVILAEIPDQPGGMATALETLAELNINVEYTYATANSLIVFGVANLERSEERLRARGFRLLDNAELAML